MRKERENERETSESESEEGVAREGMYTCTCMYVKLISVQLSSGGRTSSNNSKPVHKLIGDMSNENTCKAYT